MRRLAWLLLGAVVVIALAVGLTDRHAATNDERTHRIGRTVMCPACSGETVADSQAPVAVNIRRQIASRVAAGESDQHIRDALASTYGERVILNPPHSGVAGLVWVLPVAALVVAAAALALAFRRWRVPADVIVTDEDRAAADRARQVGP
jgi:cytochrome c-type biogenesis protein CcmH